MFQARDNNWNLLAEIDDALLLLPTVGQLGSAKYQPQNISLPYMLMFSKQISICYLCASIALAFKFTCTWLFNTTYDMLPGFACIFKHSMWLHIMCAISLLKHPRIWWRVIWCDVVPRTEVSHRFPWNVPALLWPSFEVIHNGPSGWLAATPQGVESIQDPSLAQHSDLTEVNVWSWFLGQLQELCSFWTNLISSTLNLVLYYYFDSW